MALLVPGTTCWRVVRADRLSMIQDAGPCFSYMADAIEAARRSVFILGWDVDSRTVLRPDKIDDADRLLLPLLRRCLERRPELEIFVLSWDFSFIYSFEREPAPRRQFGAAHPRLHFALDADHGSGGSHHQKLLVVDDAVGFVGGIDLTHHRWDEPSHAVMDPRRLDGDGKPYGPFHEVEVAVSGPAAAALGELARTRWNTRRRRRTPPVRPGSSAIWPANLTVDVSDLDVGFARTLTRPGIPGIREIEATTVAAIASARRSIYVENQYLTSRVAVRALGDRLVSQEGPDVVVVLPLSESGWMEQSSMGLLRQEALSALRAADRHGRLRLLAPVVRAANDNHPIAVHSKVLVVDDHVAKIGSANLSNRSMGLDSECDVIVEARDPAGAAFVASVRDRLLAEHWGVSPRHFAASLKEAGSLCRVIDHFAKTPGPRGLVVLPETCDAPVDLTLLDGAMVDPPEPWNADLLLKRAIPLSLRRRLARRWLRPLMLAAAVIAIWAALRAFGPGGGQLRSIVGAGAAWIAARPGGSVAAVGAIALGGAIFIPITVLIASALAVFGFWPGIAIAWVGATLGAVISHAFGRRLGPRALAWLPDRSLVGLRRFLGRRAFWAVVLARLLPVGNFGLLNLMAGAAGVPRRPFVLGNLVGLLPGLLGMGVFANRALEAVRNPTPRNVMVAVLLVAVAVGIAIVAKRRFDRGVANGAA